MTERPVCEFCGMVWGLSILAACGYAVFVLGHSGWWFVLGVPLACHWTCDYKTASDK